MKRRPARYFFALLAALAALDVVLYYALVGLYARGGLL